MKTRLLMAAIIIGLCALSFSAMASTNYNSAMSAYERQDYSDAFNQFSELADQNNPHAQFMLGKMYATGEGVFKNYIEAYKWLYLAEIGGVDGAAHLKKRMSKKMSYKSISEAQQLTADWYEVWRASALQSPPTDTYEIKDFTIIKMVQQNLQDQGYYFGKVDGVSGPGTQNAIMVYQHSKGIQEDGRITESLLKLMDIPSASFQVDTDQSQNEEVLVLKNELLKIIEKAERLNSAAPWLIASLQHLAAGEIDPWPNEVLSENFQDQGYLGSEAWRVIDGSFRLEPGVGLIGNSNDGWSSSNQIDDLALSLLEVLINKKQPSTLIQKMSKIESTQNFSDAFAVKVRTGSLQATQGLLLSCTSSESSTVGYQLAFHPGQSEQAKLFRISGNNATEIFSRVSPIKLEPDTDHTFTWSRKENGAMVVSVDNQLLLTASDRKDSQQRFDKLAVTHFGDQIIFQEIQLRDTSDN